MLDAAFCLQFEITVCLAARLVKVFPVIAASWYTLYRDGTPNFFVFTSFFFQIAKRSNKSFTVVLTSFFPLKSVIGAPVFRIRVRTPYLFFFCSGQYPSLVFRYQYPISLILRPGTSTANHQSFIINR